MTSLVLLTGGTGTLGRLVVPLLRDAGCKIRVLSRGSHEPGDGFEFVTGDLVTGEGIEAAVDGADTIVHCAGSAKATPTRPTPWCGRRRGPVPSTWCTSRSSAPDGSRS